MPGLKKIPIPQLLRTTWYTRILLVLMKMLSFWGILDNQENWIHLVKCQYHSKGDFPQLLWFQLSENFFGHCHLDNWGPTVLQHMYQLYPPPHAFC